METNEITLIATEVKIIGTIEVKNELHLFGHIMGEVKGLAGSTIYLKEGSLIEGKVFAETLIVEGFIKGEVHCTQKAWITPRGKVVGSIQTPSLQVDPGAIFEVKVEMV